MLCKIREITIDYKNMLNVDFSIVKYFVNERSDASVSMTNEHKITKDRNNTILVSTCERKDAKIMFDKRVIIDNHVSYPYGFYVEHMVT